MKGVVLLLLASLLLVPGCVPNGGRPAAVTSPLPYRFTLEWSSQIPDPYYVLAGPSQSYRRFPFNGWAEKALRRQLALRSGAAQGPEVKVAVKLQSLTTDYRELGEAPTFPPLLFSGLGPVARGGFDNDGGPAIPEEIHKSVWLKGEVTILLGERVLAHRAIDVEIKRLINWQDFDDWSYDYGALLKELVAVLRTEVDATLVRALKSA